METTLSTRMGFNVEKMEAFNAYAAEHPNEVLLGIEAKTIWEGRSGESLGKIGPWQLGGQRIAKPTRDYSIQFGAWKEVADAIGMEAPGDKIEPVEAALAAVCSCVTWAITINAAREGLTLDGLEVKARAKVDPRVLLGIVPVEEAASCLQVVEMAIDVRGDLTDDDRQRIAEMAKRSPVHALISYPNTIRTTVRVQ